MTATTRPPVAAADLHAAFLRQLPRIYGHAQYAFRHVACADSSDDRVAETVALAWKHFAALTRRGKDPAGFVTTLSLRASQAVKAGRRLVRSDGARDALSPVAKVRHGFVVSRLPHPRCDVPPSPRRWPTTAGRRYRIWCRSGSTTRRGGPGSGRAPGRSWTSWRSAGGPARWRAGSASAWEGRARCGGCSP